MKGSSASDFTSHRGAAAARRGFTPPIDERLLHLLPRSLLSPPLPLDLVRCSDDVSLSAANMFRLQVIAAKEVGSTAPVRSIDGNTFLYIRHKDMFFVGVTRANSNAGAPRLGRQRGGGQGLLSCPQRRGQ
jgi:hypothetical protein